MREECGVYIFGAPSMTFGYTVKVGMSNNCGYRLIQVRANNPEDVKYHFHFTFANRDLAREVERTFHDLMDGWHIRNEWFDLYHEEALFMLAMVVVRVLSRRYQQPALAIARRECGLLRAFEITDRLSDEFQSAWNNTWADLTEVEDA